MVAKHIPAHTLISVMGFYAGNYGPNYGKLTISPQERKVRKRKAKIAKASKKRNRN